MINEDITFVAEGMPSVFVSNRLDSYDNDIKVDQWYDTDGSTTVPFSEMTEEELIIWCGKQAKSLSIQDGLRFTYPEKVEEDGSLTKAWIGDRLRTGVLPNGEVFVKSLAIWSDKSEWRNSNFEFTSSVKYKWVRQVSWELFDFYFNKALDMLADGKDVDGEFISSLYSPYNEQRAKVPAKQRNTFWGKGFILTTADLAIAKWIHSKLDKQLLTITLKATNKATLLDYNQVVRNKQVYLQILAESPKALPLVHYWIMALNNALNGNTWTSNPLPITLGITQGILHDIKAVLARVGLTEGGWRALLSQQSTVIKMFASRNFPSVNASFSKDGSYQIQSLNGDQIHIDNEVHLLNLIAKSNVGALPSSVYRNLLWFGNLFMFRDTKYADDETLPVVFRNAVFTVYNAQAFLRAVKQGAKLARKRGELKSWANGELHDACDWLARGTHTLGTANLQKSQANAGWQWFQRKSDEWHAEVSQKSYDTKLAKLEWQSLVDMTEFDENVQAVPLVTGADLIAEGKAMHHCVGTYINSCYSGKSRIFSIRKKGRAKPMATMELVWRDADKKWEIAQVRGLCNAPVPKDVDVIATKVRQLYAKAWAKTGLTSVLRVVNNERNAQEQIEQLDYLEEDYEFPFFE